MLGFHPEFDIRHKQDGRAVSSLRRPHFTSKGIAWYSFLSKAERTAVLLNVGRRNRSLEHFQGPYRELNPLPPVMWRSTSNNCAPLLSFTCVKILSCWQGYEFFFSPSHQDQIPEWHVLLLSGVSFLRGKEFGTWGCQPPSYSSAISNGCIYPPPPPLTHMPW